MKLLSYTLKQDVYEIEPEKKQLPGEEKVENMSKTDKYIYTFIHLYIHLVYGLSLSSMAPAFVDFKHLLNTEMEYIGLFPTFQSIGTLLGSTLTGLYKWVNRQIVLSVLVMGMGLGTLFQPWATSLWHLYACIFAYGMGIGVWNGANNVILIEMYQGKSPSVLQFSQFIYGIGTVLGPLLTSYFVIGDMICPGVYPEQCDAEHNIDHIELYNISRPTYSPDHHCDIACVNFDRRPQLKIPFLISGLVVMIGPIMLFAMYFIRKYHYKNDSKIEVAITEEAIARHKKYVPTKTILVCISIFFAFGIMSENMYTDFSTTFFQFQRTLHLTAEKSAQIFSTMSIALSTGRFLSIFIAIYVKPQYMICGQIIFIVVGYIVQIIGQDNLFVLWASAIVICFGYSSIFICLFSFVGQYMEMTDKVGGLFIGSYNSIYLFLPYFIAKFIPEYPTYFLYLEFTCMCISIVVFIIVTLAVRNVPKDLIRKLGPVSGH